MKEKAKELIMEYYNAMYSTKSEEERYRDARLMAIICQNRVTKELIINSVNYDEQQQIFDYLINNEVETILS
jgi:hypothetical protein